jgi:hypothetical protein
MTFNISRTAIVVARHINGGRFDREAKRMAQIIGQYCGTDVSFRPGDEYITIVRFHTEHVPDKRMVPVVTSVRRHGLIRWFEGFTYNVWRVVSVTPCTVRAHMIKKYEAYECIENNPVLGLEGLFVQARESTYIRTFRPNMDRQRNVHDRFDELDLNTAVEYTFGELMKVDPTQEIGNRLIPTVVTRDFFRLMGGHRY